MSVTPQAELVAKLHRSLERLLPKFVQRSQQKTMMSRSLKLFDQSMVGLIEAPTGTGKSLGYLLPGLATARLEQRLLVVSTATASLQDQLALDIPLLSRAFEDCGERPIQWAVAKGRERHVCPVRLDEATSVKDMFNGEEDQALDQVSDAFSGGDWNGLRDSLPVSLTSAQWNRINNTSPTCIGKRCALYDDCPYYRTQERIRQADVVITNHDYLLTSLANIPGSPLAAENTIYVFDEAHHLPAKLLSAFARRLDLNGIPEDLLTSVLPLCAEHRRSVEIASEACREQFGHARTALQPLLVQRSMLRFKLGRLPTEVLDLLSNLQGSVEGLLDSLEKAKDSLKAMKSMKGKGPRRTAVIDIGEMKLGQLIGEVSKAKASLVEICGDEDLARWVTQTQGGIQLCSSPFEASTKARRYLWPVAKCALLTSATLTALGDFRPTLFELGLPKDTLTLKLTTPFDYSHAKLLVPRMAVEGTDKLHGRLSRPFVAEKAVRATEHQGVLVYFTSKRQMIDCYDYLSNGEQELVLMQGKLQPSALLAEHRRRIDAGQRSVIFGMDSLGEGVDLPGLYCTRVLIARLPFPSPDDPVIATHAEFLTQRGHDPFQLLTLPKAGLKFAQVCGRLIRREGDSGDVLVLDRRIVSKRYGKRMVRGTEFQDAQAV